MSLFQALLIGLFAYLGSKRTPWFFGVAGGWNMIGRPLVAGLIVGIILVLHGFYDLQQAVFLGRAKYGFWWLVLLLAGLTIVLGGILLWNPFEAMSIAIKFIGVFLVFDGVSDLWIFSRARRITRQIRETVEDSMEENFRNRDDIID